jgi:hypothetical protein
MPEPERELRELEWVQEKLGGLSRSGAYRFLRTHGVRVIRGRVLESEFFNIWRRPKEEPANRARDFADGMDWTT